MSDRPNRESDTRERQARKSKWKPPTLLPDPTPQPGIAFRWVRTATMGEADALNVSTKMREGWEVCKAEDHPELQIMSDMDPTFPGSVQIGGLMLCKTSAENMEARNEYFREKTARQMESVDNNYLRENDPRMPLMAPYRKSRTTYGSTD